MLVVKSLGSPRLALNSHSLPALTSYWITDGAIIRAAQLVFRRSGN